MQECGRERWLQKLPRKMCCLQRDFPFPWRTILSLRVFMALLLFYHKISNVFHKNSVIFNMKKCSII